MKLETPAQNQQLPLWRLIAAILVLAGMAGILLALIPVYFENYQLSQYIRSLVLAPNAANTPNETLRAGVLARAQQLDLPVDPGDVRISRSEGKLRMQINYKVQLDFALYQLDLHFHPAAATP